MIIKKKFTYEGLELRIVQCEEEYMNSGQYINVTRVIGPNGAVIPVTLKHKQSLKSIVASTTELLASFKRRGADVKKELTREI